MPLHRSAPLRRLLLVLTGTAVAGVAAAGTAAAVLHGEVLPGTTVAGRDVGGLGRDDLRSVVAGPLRQDLTSPVELRVADAPYLLDADTLGLDLDVPATAQAARRAGRTGPGAVLAPLLSLLGATRQVPAALPVDPERVRAAVRQVKVEVDRPADPGGFRVVGTAVEPRAPEPGLTVQAAPTSTLVGEALERARRAPVVALVEVTPAPVDQDAVDAVVAQARSALRTPLTLGSAPVSVTLTPQALAPLLGSTVRAGALALTVDQDGLRASVEGQVGALARSPRDAVLRAAAPTPRLEAKGDASFAATALAAQVVPGADGRRVDLDLVVERLTDAVSVGASERGLPVTIVPPRTTTEALRRVDQLIGTFTTSFPAGRPRVQNIRRIAQLVDGAVVLPGETFSLNERAGRRTAARGFVADGAIVDGELTDQIGGGVSQFSTTLYNAAWFSGVEIVSHTPHSRYISRYPPGREATLDFASIDLVFRNTTDAPLVVRTSSTPNSVTAALYGHVGARTVQSLTGPREPRRDGGFTVATVRRILDGTREVDRSRYRWTYQPPLD